MERDTILIRLSSKTASTLMMRPILGIAKIAIPRV